MLVIIGLIVGGVLVGRDLISAAATRAQITQIEKYQQAVNTFRGKYNYLPGDIPEPHATQFGFSAVAPRGALSGSGDGNGVIEGLYNLGWCGSSCAWKSTGGETATFWVDLTVARLIDGSFSTARETSYPNGGVALTGLGAYFPVAKIGNGNFVYIWSGGFRYGLPWSTYDAGGDGKNYFGITTISSIGTGGNSSGFYSTVGMTVKDAYNIDKKIDDGLPQTGNTLAQYSCSGDIYWAIGGGGCMSNVFAENPGGTAAASSVTCYDNNNVAAATMNYSITQNAGAGMNCALVFRFQ